ncbi:MAG: hypothetical protein NC094_05050 [Bacteroidales bacterium]|nr:hypothetical protein [Lachnoclostridium sp.]MCM1384269.1 hypothetical protein [Lachnoclostridium sp.]MCM1464768.1 hypothetical protein [Bacteroidales bacterium]
MNKQSQENPQKETHKITSKQIVAMIGVLLLLALYITTFIVAFVDNSASGKLFSLCLYGTVTIPLIIWIYTWMYGKLTGKKTIADFKTDVEQKNNICSENPENKEPI